MDEETPMEIDTAYELDILREYDDENSILVKILSVISDNVCDDLIKTVVNTITDRQIGLIYLKLFKTDITLMPKLKVSVLYVCIRSLLLKWKGYYESISMKDMQSKLMCFLTKNIKYIDSVYNDNVAKCMKERGDGDIKSIVEMKCPYRHLKTIVYHNTNPKTQSIINSELMPKSIPRGNSRIMDIYKHMFNSPFIKLKISNENFEITRENIHKSVYKFIKLTPNYKPTFKLADTVLKCSRESNVTSNESFPSKFIIEFLEQFKSAIRSELGLSVNKKMDFLSILTEFHMDIAKCTEEIEVGTEYYSYNSAQPYVRYLGAKETNKPIVPLSEQKETQDQSQNIRLQELIYPCVKFQLKKFGVYYHMDDKDKNKFDLPPNYVNSTIDRGLTFGCTLCNFEASGHIEKHLMEAHIYEEHGEEPNWSCTVCSQEFTMKVLCSQRWDHKCKKTK